MIVIILIIINLVIVVPVILKSYSQVCHEFFE